MANSVNRLLLLRGRILLQHGYKIMQFKPLSLYTNNISSFQIIQKNTFCASATLKDETNIVKSYCNNIEIPQNVPFHRFIWEKNVDLYGNKIALVDGISGASYTYEEASTISIKFGTGMRRNGLKEGDVFAIFLPNCPEYIISLTGVIGAGGVVTTINPAYTETEIARQLEMSGASFILTRSNMIQVAKEAIEKCTRKIEMLRDS